MWIIDEADCEETSARGDALHRQIERARHAAQDAYRTVRWLVFDRLPPGPVDEDLLDEPQRRALLVWQRAERALDCLRRTAHRRGDGDGCVDADARYLPTDPVHDPMKRQS